MVKTNNHHGEEEQEDKPDLSILSEADRNIFFLCAAMVLPAIVSAYLSNHGPTDDACHEAYRIAWRMIKIRMGFKDNN